MRVLGAILMLAALSQPALAETSLCVDSGTTGFDWANGEWQQMNFETGSYLIKEIAPEDPIGLSCYASLFSERLRSETDGPVEFGPAWSCFGRTDVGTQMDETDVTRCRKFVVADGKNGSVNCTYAGVVEYQFQPTGEIVTTRTYAALLTPSATGSRDSLAISVGKCTVVAP